MASAKSGWITIISGVIVVIVLILIHSTLSSQKPPHQVDLVTIGIQHNPMGSLVVIAESQGYFQKVGLNVKLQLFSSDYQALQALLRRRISLATASNIPILIQAFRKKPVRLIAVLNEAQSMAHVVVRRSSGIRVPRDLVGRRIAAQTDSSTDYYTYLFLRHYGIPVSDVNLVYMPSAKLIEALRSGYIDACVLRSPYLDLAEKYMPGELHFFSVADLFSARLDLAVMEHGLKSHPQTIQKVLEALMLALKYTEQHQQQAQQDAIRFFGTARRDEILRLWPHYDFSVDLANQLIPSLEQQSQWVIHSGKGLAQDKPDFKVLIDPKPLTAARRALGVPVPKTPFYDTPPQPLKYILKARLPDTSIVLD